MRSELVKILHKLVLDNPIPAKTLAQKIGKPYSTLLREINPYDPGAKLGVETLLQIMHLTQDVSPLEYMANQLGYTLISRSCKQSNDEQCLNNSWACPQRPM